MKICAVIPARSGSSLVNKNTIEFLGTSLLELAISEAKKCSLIMEIVVSSDSDDYLKIATNEGVSAHKRPDWASTNSSTAQNVLDSLGDRLSEFDGIVYLQPTSPMRKRKHIEDCLEMFLASPKCSVVSVTTLRQYPEKILELLFSGDLKNIPSQSNNPFGNRPPQDSRVYPNGAIYVIPKNLSNRFSFSFEPRVAYMMSGMDSIDIDFEEDFQLVKAIFNET